MYIPPVTDILDKVYSWAIKDKIFHYGIVRNGLPVIGNTITGGTSTATGTITAIGSQYVEYTKTSTAQFQRNETITTNSGVTMKVGAINEFHTSIADKIFFQEASEVVLNSLAPYCVYNWLGVPVGDFDSGYNTKIRRLMIDFKFYFNTSDSLTLVQILSQLQTIYDFPEFSFTNWDYSQFILQGITPVLRDENKIWTSTATYVLTVSVK